MTEKQDADAKAAAAARRLTRWQGHLAARKTTIPDAEDYLSFGALSSLERLRDVLAIASPEHCGPLARVISDLKRKKTFRAGKQAKGGMPGIGRQLSVPISDLPEDWKATLGEMRRRRTDLDAGMIDLGDIPPPAKSQIRAIEYVLCCIARVCLDAGRPAELDMDSIGAWLSRQEGRGQVETSSSLQLRKIREFLIYRAENKALSKRLAKEAARYGRIGRLKRKRKHSWLLASPTDIGKVWALAEDLLEQSRDAKPGTSRRYLLALHAAVLALAVAAPLRIGDLWRLRIGGEITRDVTGWSMALATQKTGGDYDRPELWPELTEFLDELLVLEAPGGDLWVGYEQRQGTPLFSRDGGATPLSADWISDVWYEHVGTGAHIVRTLWHQLAYDSDIDRTWMALALCGQHARSTASAYHEKNTRARAVRAGRQALMAVRQEAMNRAITKLPD